LTLKLPSIPTSPHIPEYSLYSILYLPCLQLTQYVSVLRLMNAPTQQVSVKLLAAHKQRSLRMINQFKLSLSNSQAVSSYLSAAGEWVVFFFQYLACCRFASVFLLLVDAVGKAVRKLCSALCNEFSYVFNQSHVPRAPLPPFSFHYRQGRRQHHYRHRCLCHLLVAGRSAEQRHQAR